MLFLDFSSPVRRPQQRLLPANQTISFGVGRAILIGKTVLLINVIESAWTWTYVRMFTTGKRSLCVALAFDASAETRETVLCDCGVTRSQTVTMRFTRLPMKTILKEDFNDVVLKQLLYTNASIRIKHATRAIVYCLVLR